MFCALFKSVCNFCSFVHLCLKSTFAVCFSRAPRELDGHKGDPDGGNGVQCEVPGHDIGGSA